MTAAGRQPAVQLAKIPVRRPTTVVTDLKRPEAPLSVV